MPVALISTRTSPGFGPSKATAARVFMVGSSVLTHASVFSVRIGRGFVFMLCRPHASYRVVGARAQIDVNVVHVAGDVRIVAERRHYVLLRRVDVLAAACDHSQEVGVAYRLERVLQRGGIGRSHSVRSVADMAFRMIAAVSGIGVPIDL